MARKKNNAAAGGFDGFDGSNLSPKMIRVIEAIKAQTGRTPTKYQIAIFQWMIEGTGHAVINAVAGSGKTTTLHDGCYAISVAVGNLITLLLAFNKAIAVELGNKIRFSHCTSKTLNGLGFGILARNSKTSIVMDDDKTIKIAKQLVNFDSLTSKKEQEFLVMLPAIKKLVALFKGFGYGAIRPMPTNEDVNELCDRYDIDLPDDVDYQLFFDILIQTFEKGIKETRIYDFNDQLYMPIKLNLPFPTYNKFILIDESQDLNAINMEMIKRLAARGARCLFVGDRNQAIYGFRGADPEAIDTVIKDFKAVEMPLSICFRCPKAVVREAQRIVPHIEYAETAKEGRVETIKEEEMFMNIKQGDFILCRTVAPLAETCMQLIREGKKATIKGSDIGTSLCSTLDKIGKSKEGKGCATVWEKINAWGDKEIAKLNKPGQENKVSRMMDRVATLLVLAEDCESIKEVKDKILKIFSDNVVGIMLSSIHRAKGLESDNVYILHPELLPHPMAKKAWAKEQEKNLEYVAITRAMDSLFWVLPENPIKFGKKKNVEPMMV